MRTRIALVAATAAALSICISNTVLVGQATGAPRAASSHRGATGVLTPSATALTPGGFLAPTLSAVHRWAVPRRPRQDSPPATGSAFTRALAVRATDMERVINAWRAQQEEEAAQAAAAQAAAAQAAAAAAEAAAAEAPVITDATSTTTPDWACIRVHESGDRYNTPAAPGGAYGFLESTWLSLGYGGWPYQAPAAVQDKAVLYLYHEFGWQPWSTRFVCGL